MTAKEVVLRQKKATDKILIAEQIMGKSRLAAHVIKEALQTVFPRVKIDIKIEVRPDRDGVWFLLTAFVKDEVIFNAYEPVEDFPSIDTLAKLGLIG